MAKIPIFYKLKKGFTRATARVSDYLFLSTENMPKMTEPTRGFITVTAGVTTYTETIKHPFSHNPRVELYVRNPANNRWHLCPARFPDVPHPDMPNYFVLAGWEHEDGQIKISIYTDSTPASPVDVYYKLYIYADAAKDAWYA